MCKPWLYNNGEKWFPLNRDLQIAIERLWETHSSEWVQSNQFGRIYVDIKQLTIKAENASYKIARGSGRDVDKED
ncbi:hypothetical protein CLU79DRAFT_763211 [Phycomyces nitens]|nr:hypothetical protein CLU79DRAFT_763211 [Phycomyces nitens]